MGFDRFVQDTMNNRIHILHSNNVIIKIYNYQNDNVFYKKYVQKNLKKVFFCATLTPSTLNERKTDEKNSLDFMCLYADIGVYRHTTAG